jgi:hypothetical protein
MEHEEHRVNSQYMNNSLQQCSESFTIAVSVLSLHTSPMLWQPILGRPALAATALAATALVATALAATAYTCTSTQT